MNADGSGADAADDQHRGRHQPVVVAGRDEDRLRVHRRDGNTEIYAMNANGSGQTRLHEQRRDRRLPQLAADAARSADRRLGDGGPRAGDGELHAAGLERRRGDHLVHRDLRPGRLAGDRPSQPDHVIGLTNGVTYRFSVAATNGAGTGPPSALSNPVIPPEALTVTIHATGVYGTAPNLTGLAPGNPAISYSPAGQAGNVTGTLTCSTTAVATSPVGAYPISLCSGLADAGFSIVYDYADSNYTVTKAPLTVTADDKSRLFGAANPPLTATLSGFVLGQTLATSGVSGSASCTTTAMPFSAGGTYPITCTVGSLTATNYSFGPFVPGTLTVGYSQPCITATRGGGLVVAAGQAMCIAAGATISGGVTVQAGGALDIEGGTVSGGLRSTGAATLRLCGSIVSGGTTITGTTGLVLIGGDAATGPCAGNTLTNTATLTGNSGGVEFNTNTVTGGLTITGNTGTLPPPDTGSVHVVGNTVSGPSNIQP